jgi:uncharacterized protein DUF892
VRTLSPWRDNLLLATSRQTLGCAPFPRETTDQVERLERIFELIEQPAKGKACDAINGMIDESQQVFNTGAGSKSQRFLLTREDWVR